MYYTSEYTLTEPRSIISTSAKMGAKKTDSYPISVLRLLPSPADSLNEISLSDLLAAREVPSGDLGVDLNTRVRWKEVVCIIKSETCM